ncbi:MAG: hypothetical protein AB7K71_06240 [Polyangiaceae bacterium]
MAQQFLSSLDDLWNRGEQKGRTEGRAEGRTEGRAEGRGGLLREQLQLKFGDLPAWVEKRLHDATDEQIGVFARRILSETTLEATLATEE